MMNSTIQIRLDQAIISNTNALFKDCPWVEPYSTIEQRPNHIVREILMKILPSFGSIRWKLTKFCLFQFFVAPSSVVKTYARTATARGIIITTIAAIASAAVAPWLNLLFVLILLKIINFLSITVPPHHHYQYSFEYVDPHVLFPTLKWPFTYLKF